MTTIASQITSLTVVYSTAYSDAHQRNIKAPRHWPLCGEFTGTGEFPAQRASYAENVSIWWRHHGDQAIVPLPVRQHMDSIYHDIPITSKNYPWHFYTMNCVVSQLGLLWNNRYFCYRMDGFIVPSHDKDSDSSQNKAYIGSRQRHWSFMGIKHLR